MREGTSLILVAALSLCACSGDEGTGELAVEIWGEEFIEEGIGGDHFVDGWSVTFSRFLVAAGGISLSRGEGRPDLSDDAQRVFDLVRPGPHHIVDQEVPAGRYDSTGYDIRPAGDGAIAGNAAAADVQLMVDEGLSVYAEGTATDGADTKTFAWGFETATSYVDCHSEAELERGGAATVQLTIHGDHLFYDDLFAEEPALTFALLAAADADADGEVTAEDLASHDIGALPNYGTGSEDVEDLWAFVSFLTRTLGHIDGEGHCQTR